MSSRDVILQRIRNGLVGSPSVELPPVAEVWPRREPSRDEMAQRFAAELQTVQGECHRCGSMAAARSKLKELLDAEGWPCVAAMDRPPCRELVADLPAERVEWPRPTWTPVEMAKLPVSLIYAERLLADTGSAVIGCNTPQERLLCYLPPACIVVGRTDQLAEHLPAAWESVAAEATARDRRGEYVIITGPSRTADIEKVLILGVHGPKRLVVLLVD